MTCGCGLSTATMYGYRLEHICKRARNPCKNFQRRLAGTNRSFFMLDGCFSAGWRNQRLKIDIAKEIGGALYLVCQYPGSHQSRFIMLFSDRNEFCMSGHLDGMKHAYLLISELYKTLFRNLPKPTLRMRSWNVLNVLKDGACIFLISDFIDNNYQHNLESIGPQA